MANNVFDRLQFVKHEEIFQTREDAVNYVLGIQPIDRPSLLGEPMILLYESGSVAKGPNVILAIGSVGDGKTHTNANKTFFIDTQKTEDEIEELWEYIEQAIKSLTIVPIDSDTINLNGEKTAEGTILSGDVKIADYRIIDGKVVENIIETEGDKGIYTFVDMEYDPETFVITFKTTKETKEFQLPPDQHVIKGWYSTDDEAIYLKLADGSKIKVDVVKLIDEWTVLSGASSTPICLYKEHVSSSTESHDGVYDWQDILTADVRVADHIDDNIIHKDRTGRFLYVKGTADNIMYRDGKTVQEALDTIDTRVSTSTGNIIYKRPDGIYAYAMLDYNTAENKLIYTYSDGNTSDLKEVEFKLNSVKLLEDITYDPVREMIVIRYIDAQGEYQRVEIPVKDIIEEWVVNNEAHNVELTKYRSEGQGKDILSADVKIHNGDNNILEDKDHTLYVNGIASNIKYDVTGNTTVKDAIDQEVARAESVETALNEALISESQRANNAEQALDEKINQEIADRNANVERIDTTIGSGFSTDAHETVTYKFNELQSQVNSESNKLQNEINRSTAKDTEHDGRLDAVDAEIGDGFGPRNTVRDEIDNLQNELDAVSSDTSMRLTDVINEDESIDVETRNDSNGNPTVKVVKVNLSTEVEDNRNNIIKLNSDGLFANVDLSYEKTANKLIFHTSNGQPDKEIQLDGISSIIDIEYIPSLEAIRITYMTNGHEIKTVDIPVGDLIREWQPSENTNGAIKLTLTTAPSGTTGKDILYAETLISDHDDNILVNDGGFLYVSNSTITANTEAIEELENRMNAAEADIDVLQDGLREEISARTLADNALGERINQEIEDRIADVNEEEERAKDAELALSNKIDADVLAEKNRAVSAETALDTKIAQEIANREAAVLAEKNRAEAAETDLKATINSANTRAITNENRIEHLLNDEIARSTAKDAEIEESLNSEINRSTTRDLELSKAITDEVTRATSAETELQTAINSEITRAIGEESRILHLVSDEENRAKTAESGLSNSIAAEESRAREIEDRLETWLNNEVDRAQTAEGELNVAITNETLRANAADNELYQKIADETRDRGIADAELNERINDEENRAISAETVLKNSLTLETNNRLNAEENLSNALTAETLARQEKDADLEQMIIGATLSFDDTTSIDFTKTSGNVVTADVKLQQGDNIIKLGQGLYATAHLSYDTGTNKIKLTTTAGEEEYQLAGATVIDNLEYDSTNKELVITYHDGNGGVHTVRFGVSELFNEWSVNNPSENSAVELTKTPSTVAGGEDKLSGRILLTNLEDNAIRIVNNGLYVSNGDMEDAKEIAECAKNELKVLEKAVIGHQVGEECGSGYTYEPNLQATYINSATSFNNADFILDSNIKRVENKIDTISGDTDCVDSKANKLYELLYGEGRTMTECGEGTHYQPYVGSCIISAATSFNEADQMLNDQICEILTMWVSGISCTNESEWIEDGLNRKIQVNTRISRGRFAQVTDDDVYIKDLYGEYIDPTNSGFTDTNVLRVVCLDIEPSGTTPSIDSLQNGLYLSNEWDCGLYYGPSDAEAKERAESYGYRTDPYSTDETSDAHDYNYMNNVRL